MNDLLLIGGLVVIAGLFIVMFIGFMPDRIVEQSDEWEDFSETDDELECARLRDMGLWEEDIKLSMENKSRNYYLPRD